ncbi:MAG: hypothetical protein NUV92_09180 [Ignavibacteria bacterium]|jgi:hypothetical protein|nr:hypothetical protein [Ignavibacteria bacterium]
MNSIGLLEVKGWASFVNLKDKNNNYSWLSLSRKIGELSNDNLGYGLYLFKNLEEPNVYQLKGLTWHTNFGWVSFGGPILVKVENLGIGANKKAQIKATWLNLVDYSNKLTFFDPAIKSIINEIDCSQAPSLCQRGQKDKIIMNLEPNTNYKIQLKNSY